jgi:CRISPR type I-E-associated protein CasB/Cse2
MALLNSDAEHLPGHLRQTISLLKSEENGLDRKRLLLHVLAWGAPGTPVQKRWITDYYRTRRNDTDGDSVPEGTTQGE